MHGRGLPGVSRPAVTVRSGTSELARTTNVTVAIGRPIVSTENLT